MALVLSIDDLPQTQIFEDAVDDFNYELMKNNVYIRHYFLVFVKGKFIKKLINKRKEIHYRHK